MVKKENSLPRSSHSFPVCLLWDLGWFILHMIVSIKCCQFMVNVASTRPQAAKV